MNKRQIVKFQFLSYAFVSKISLTDRDIDILTYLAIEKSIDIDVFMSKCFEKKYTKTLQSLKVWIYKFKKLGIISKQKDYIFISPKLNIQTEGNILLEYKFLYAATSLEE
jgi:hypothetical protein